MVEFKQFGNYFQVHVNNYYCMEILEWKNKYYAGFLVECPREEITAADLRQIADKLDELNAGCEEK